MKETINLWLSKNARLPGVLACGVRYPDRTAFTQTWSSQLVVAALENAWRCAADAFQVLQLNRLTGEWVRWVYDQAYLYCTRRPDGIFLGLITSKDPLSFDPVEIQRLLAEFRTLSAVASER